MQARLTHITHQVTVLPPHLSEAQPPSARIAPEGRSNRMVRNAAVASGSPYWPTYYLGSHSAIATNAPNTK